MQGLFSVTRSYSTFESVFWLGIEAGLHILALATLNSTHTFVRSASAKSKSVDRGLLSPGW